MSDDPNFRLGGLRLWIDRYQYKAETDYWDSNWVVVRLECVGHNAVVKLCDPCLRVPELKGWAEACTLLANGEADSAALDPMEPYLNILIDRSDKDRGLLATVKITPDGYSQFHEFRFPIDQSDLARLVQSLAVVLSRFPIRGDVPPSHSPS
ncbi:MAG: hypothetical protein JNK16_02115 [Phycisphaerales bacterium]|nr:hypothetical protein [Phycisphaerales bacterium]